MGVGDGVAEVCPNGPDGREVWRGSGALDPKVNPVEVDWPNPPKPVAAGASGLVSVFTPNGLLVPEDAPPNWKGDALWVF